MMIKAYHDGNYHREKEMPFQQGQKKRLVAEGSWWESVLRAVWLNLSYFSGEDEELTC